MKRILLFLATNIAVMVVLSIVLRLLGVDRILDESGTGLNMINLLIFCGGIRLRRFFYIAGYVQMDGQTHDGSGSYHQSQKRGGNLAGGNG